MSHRIEKQIELKAPISRVWQAISDPRQFGEWFRVKIETEFVPGQEAHGQILYPGYEHLTWHATVQKIEPERLFSFTWHPYGIDKSIDYSAETPTLVEFHLEPMETGTRLTIIESGFDKVPAYRRDEAFRMNDKGWTQQVKNIETYIAEHP